MIRITKHQLFGIFILFEIGSTTLFALGIDAKQDAWIAILVAMMNGFVLLWIYTEIQRFFPKKNLAEIIIALLGKYLGFPIVLLYALYFIEASVLNFSEFGFLISMTFLEDTPLIVTNAIFLLATLFYMYWGVEIMSRTTEIVYPIFLLFFTTIIILTSFSNIIKIDNLVPIAGGGFKPILEAAYPEMIIVPFGESIIMFMYWKYVQGDIRRISFLALGLTGLIITISTILIITVLGTSYAEIASVPLLEVIKLINIGDVLTNLDVIGIGFIFTGGFYKALINLFGAVLILSSLFKTNYKVFIIPVGILTLWITMSIPSLVFHRFIGWNAFARGLHVLFDIFIPILLYIILLLRKLYIKQ